ncbi:hypothetical protein PAMC26510_07370 [Caballeronia sordidicola]|uniref:Uncharacterized protein n=1 Tax=Caballeronia sordidicola TaxID=196367 RepID=A0A242N5S9_CABSO|nr:hypothetical protein PAMC26510_07370 [Caballeronia sordidicola]
MLQVRGNLTQALKRFQSDFRNISVMASDATLRLTGSVRTLSRIGAIGPFHDRRNRATG